MPRPEIDVDADRIRRLLADQCPRFADESLELHDEGWDNVTFRLGGTLAVRVPRREAAVERLLIEQRWLEEVGGGLGVDVPVPVFEGRPGPGVPWAWSIVRWVEGEVPGGGPLGSHEAPRFAHVLKRLHRPAPDAAPRNPLRGVPLAAREGLVLDRMDALAARRPAVDALRDPWERARRAPFPDRPVWIHGDLHPRNVIVRAGRIAGLIDWGDLAAGDPATDLASVWMLFDADGRDAFWLAYAPRDPALRDRALGWAIFFAVALASTDEERHRAIGVGLLNTLLQTER